MSAAIEHRDGAGALSHEELRAAHTRLRDERDRAVLDREVAPRERRETWAEFASRLGAVA
jgi:hypothetical protein